MATKHHEGKSAAPKGPTCPYHGKEMGLSNGGLHCPMSGCHHRADVGVATQREDHGFRSLADLQKELKMEDVNADLKHEGREPNIGPDGEPVLEEVGARQSEENARGVPRITEGPDGSQDEDKDAEAKSEKHKKHSR